MVKPTPITIPTEPVGRIPRLVDLIERVKNADSEDRKLAPLYDLAVRDTMERFRGAGSPVVTDGEQRKHHNFRTYCVHGLLNTAQAGFMIPFSDGLTRRLSPGHARPLPPRDADTWGHG
jgi:5-methyltetrahydropteroyltriglutamate--homocysteine methyltransferase